MAKYQKYAEYKDSGIKWLGEIPEHWIITLLKRYSFVKGGYAFSSDIFTSVGKPIIRIGDIQADGSISLENCKYIPVAVAENSQDYLVTKGQILMAMTGATIGKAGIFDSDEVAYLNQRVGKFIVDSKSLNYDYLWYLLKTHGYQEYIRLTAFGGAQPNISDTAMVDFCISIPSIDEQIKIAKFLDHETTKIDTLIAKQEKLIELLKEKRQAVISHAVTKGLNLNTPMKDSGVEWLGEVPEHWEKKILKYIVSQQGGGTPDKSNLSFWDGDIPWVSPKDMKVDYISTSQDKITVQAIEQSSTKLVPIGSVLMVVRGMILIHSVPVALNKEALTINQDMKALIPNKLLNSEYFLYLLKGLKDYLLDYVETSGHGTKCLRSDDFMNMPLFLPDVEEQKNIVEYIKIKSKKFDSLTDKAESAIQLMKERRTALISAAVTGKIDVRHWQSPNKNNNQNNMELSA
ncbi:restriction endonuclease subunit S [Acinetobacter pittii]|uniref:restriction endonuclease subunit S n=1 Tax=Acinetobacter pittii TaxID=48296 RepID=UPI0024DF024E|nr:restriction endonuclease subunit S [Acinetobacter pittii]MDX8221550.1 restriction endonuclease subunit S [Acinetobacter pittii]WPP72059.1 restriction endonuclease subunit S [Acinetobacter pittii]